MVHEIRPSDFFSGLTEKNDRTNAIQFTGKPIPPVATGELF